MGRGKYFLGVNKKDYYLFDILLTQFVCHFASKSKLQAQHACTHTHRQTDRHTPIHTLRYTHTYSCKYLSSHKTWTRHQLPLFLLRFSSHASFALRL